jgi:SAM-dependent methyltransferase
MNNHIQRSFVIPIIDFSPHSPYNICTLLQDLEDIEGEVICIFNSTEVYEELKSHKRINKYCYNNLNAGVSRSWNIGINLSEGKAVHILNADLHVLPKAIEEVEHYLFTLDRAVIVGPQGAHVDFKNLCDLQYFSKGTFNQPIECHAISGFFFTVHLDRFLYNKLIFDTRFSPCFFEEWDIGLQAIQAGLSCYAVPVKDFEHIWGVSANPDLCINYFGRTLHRNIIHLQNREKFELKWYPVLENNNLKEAVTTILKDYSSLPIKSLQRLSGFIAKTQSQAYSEPPSTLHSQITEQMLEQFLIKYPLTENAKILDVGCGQGPALDLFKDNKFRAIGITISDEDVKACTAKGHEVYKMDQSFLDFPDEYFDFVWARHCIEHSIFPFFTLSEFYRVLKKGSYLYIEVPAPETSCHHETNVNHYSVLTENMWGSLISRSGFKVMESLKMSFTVTAGPDEYWAFICMKPFTQDISQQKSISSFSEIDK